MKLSAKAQASLDNIIAKFQSGDLSPIVEVATLRRQGEPVPFDQWSFANQVLAYMQSGSTDLRGYRQWQQVGRQVQKGSHAAFIFVPRFATKKDEEEEEQQRLIGFLTAAVFPYHVTDGQPLPEHDYTPAELPPLMDVADRLGIEVTWQPLPPDRRGDCNTEGTAINLGTHDPKTWFHELAHAAHARTNGKLKGGIQPHQETVAEFTACVLMQLYGYGDRTGNVWQYIHCLHKDPLKAIMKALAEVEKVLALLLNKED